MLELKDKVAIVTGAGQGIGREIALILAKNGAKIIVSDVTGKEEDVAKEIKNSGGKAQALKCDISNEKEVKEMINSAIEKFDKVDILVNNAGICKACDISEMQEGDWEKMIAVDLKGVFLCSRAVLPKMKEQKYGKIVNISSIAGSIVAWPKLCHYAAAKAGVAGFTRNLAFDVAPYGINVNAICPGAIETDMLDKMLKELGMTREQIIQMTPLRRIGEPKDIANAVVFLVSEKAKQITGQVLVVDGGYTIV